MTLLLTFNQYVTDVEASTSYQTWAKANCGGKGYTPTSPRPGSEVAQWLTVSHAILSGQRPTLPLLPTLFGKSLIDVAHLYLDATLPPPAPLTESPDKTTVPPAPSVVDSHGDVWTITADGKVAKNGAADPITSSVVELAYVTHVVWQKNSVGDWYPWTATGWGSATTVDPLGPPPVPGNAPKQGISAPLGNLAAHGATAMDLIKKVANGKPTFVRTDWWVADTSFPTVKALADARGLTVMAIHNLDYPDHVVYPITSYAADAAKLAKIVSWINLFNEPNGGTWPADVCGQWAAAASIQAKAANPNVQIVVPALSFGPGQTNTLTYLSAFMAAFAAAGGRADYISAHPYGDPLDPNTGWGNPWEVWPQVQAVAKQYLGDSSRVMATEGGYDLTHGEGYANSSVANGMDARGRLGFASFFAFTMMPDAMGAGKYTPDGAQDFGLVNAALVERDAFVSFQTRAL